jgi:hypothetical protein
MLLRTRNSATIVLRFVHREADKDQSNRGYGRMLGAAKGNTRHDQFPMPPVPVDGAGGWPVG